MASNARLYTLLVPSCSDFGQERRTVNHSVVASVLLCTHLAVVQVLSKLLPIVIAQLKSPHDLTRKKVRTAMKALALAVVQHALMQ